MPKTTESSTQTQTILTTLIRSRGRARISLPSSRRSVRRNGNWSMRRKSIWRPSPPQREDDRESRSNCLRPVDLQPRSHCHSLVPVKVARPYPLQRVHPELQALLPLLCNLARRNAVASRTLRSRLGSRSDLGTSLSTTSTACSGTRSTSMSRRATFFICSSTPVITPTSGGMHTLPKHARSIRCSRTMARKSFSRGQRRYARSCRSSKPRPRLWSR